MVSFNLCVVINTVVGVVSRILISIMLLIDKWDKYLKWKVILFKRMNCKDAKN